ncbi:MAG: hypothetical protein FWG87_08345 [Defluviitaleaceae bacterium]|nr:hypothetical protein [Defluviitaleaceae bacterium]
MIGRCPYRIDERTGVGADKSAPYDTHVIHPRNTPKLTKCTSRIDERAYLGGG